MRATPAVRFKKPRCHVESCRRDATRDTPLCGDHWRAIPQDLRREFMGAAHRVIDAAQGIVETCKVCGAPCDEGFDCASGCTTVCGGLDPKHPNAFCPFPWGHDGPCINPDEAEG